MKKYLNTINAFQFTQLARYATLVLAGIVFAKTTLTQESIGKYETFIFLAGAVSFFWLNGLLKALLPISAGDDEGDKAIFNGFIVIQAFSLIAGIFLMLMQPVIVSQLLNGKPVPDILLLFIFILTGVPASLTEYIYLIQKRNRAMVIYASVSNGLQLVAVSVPAIMGYGISGILTGLVSVTVLRYLWMLVIVFLVNRIVFSRSFIQKHLKLGVPLTIATFLSGSAQFIDGFIVTSTFDESTFAIFRYGARELPLAVLMANALSNAMLPEFASGKSLLPILKKLKAHVAGLMHFLFPLTIILVLISYPLFPVVFNPRFAESAPVFNIYLLLLISRLIMPQTILNGLQITRPIMTVSAAELLVNIILSLILVKYIGIQGVALATFFAFLLEKVILAMIVKKRLQIPVSAYLPVKPFIAYSLLLTIVFVINEHLYRNIF